MTCPIPIIKSPLYRTLQRFYLATIFLIVSHFGFGQLSGTYTIGGTSPNYTSLSAAITALNASGVSGAVTFNIRQGTYTERINLGSITGSSPINTVTFQADPNNTSDVTIQYTNTSSSNNYIVRLNGSKNVNFKNLKLKAVSATYSVVFLMIGINDSVSVDSCILESPTTSSASIWRAVIYEPSGSNNRSSNVSITNCSISGGAYGVYAFGYSTGIYFQKNWTIENNEIEDWFQYGMYVYNYFDTLSIIGNSIIQKANVSTTSYGVRTYRCYRTHTEGNKVVMNSANAYGLYLQQHYGSSNYRQRTANNMVSLVTSSSVGTRYGIYTPSCNYNDVVHNSIYTRGGGTAYGLYGSYGSVNVYRNNAIHVDTCNTSSYGMYLLGTLTQSNNAIWMPYAGINSNLTLGSGSKLVNPYFTSQTDLHTSSVDLNNAGVAIANVTTDYDGQTRNSSSPDIGADEFTPPSNDAGIAEIQNVTVCAGNNTIQVKLKNFGSSALTSATLNWAVKVNSGAFVNQTGTSFSGSLASGADTVISIGSYSMTATNAYTIKAWSTSPNSATDGNNANDTTTSKSFNTSLSGTYTIGGSSPSYSSIQAAATDVKNKGVCGPVIFKIRPGSYNEAVTVESGIGMSSTNTVTFTRDSAFTGDVYWWRSGRPLTFTGASHFVIRDLIMETKSFSNVIYMTGNCQNININHNTIRGINTNSSTQSYSCVRNVANSTANIHDITIADNEFRKGTSMIFLSGYSTASANRATGIKVLNNKYDSAGYYGMYLQYQDTLEVRGNTIRDNGSSLTYFGIYSNYSYLFDIEENHIELFRANGSYGIYILRGGGSASKHSSINNNFTHQKLGTYGIYTSSAGYHDVNYNTVRLEGSNINSYSAYFNYGYAYVQNNNFSNEADGYVIHARSTAYLPVCNYNNFYTTSSTRFSFGAGYRSSFNLWKSAMSRDANSYAVNPYWQAPTDPEPNNNSLNGTGNSIAGISKDLKGTTRSSSPDIGCVEFTSSTNDAGISSVLNQSICPGNSNVLVRLRNYGNNTLTQARIQWNVSTNGGTPIAQSAYSWSGSLASYADTVVSIGSYTFVGSNTYKVTAYSDRANNGTDLFSGNDTASSDSISPRMSGTYTVGGTTPDYNTLSLAMTALQTNGICGPVTLNVRAGTYNGRVTFNAITGISASNTVTIQTDPSTSGRAQFTFSSYPFLLSGAEYHTFKNITIRTLGNSSTVYFSGSNSNITFDNDSIIGSSLNTTSSSYAVLYDNTSSGAIQRDISIKNSVILNGSYGVYAYGNGSSGNFAQNGWTISKTQILNYYYIGAYMYYCPEVKISESQFRDKSIYTNAYGILAQYCDSSEFSSNDIAVRSGYGIQVYYCYGNTSTRGLSIYNNFIRFTDSTSVANSYGIYTYSTSYALIGYNSVFIPKGSANSTCLWGRFGTSHEVKNNNFVNRGTGYCQYHLTAGNIAQLDYNNNFGGTYIGYYAGNRTTMANWRSATAKATNSINVDPQFVAFNDLHVLNQSLDGAGIPIPGITQDIDGETRNSSNPDIGADEFAVYSRDAGIYAVRNYSICVGSGAVWVELRNYGTDSLVSTSIPWRVSVNGAPAVAQSTYTFSGFLRSGADTLINIGNYTFASGNTYRIEANTSGFNSSSDLNTVNDSATSTSLMPTMSGLYTVGPGASDDWSTIDSAITALETVGVCAPVTIYIKSGSYFESVSFATIPGINSTNQVTLLGDTSSTIPDWYHTGIPLTLNDVHHVNFQNLKIRSVNLRAVELNTSNSYLVFENNELIGRNSNSTSSAYAVVYNSAVSGYQQQHIKFSNNEISNGSYGFYWMGYSTGVNYESGNEWIGNKMINQQYMGMQIQYQDSFKVDSNEIILKSTASNYGYGIRANYGVHYSMYKNHIELRRGGYGIYLNGMAGTSAQFSRIANNTIVIGGTSNIYGLFTQTGSYLNIYHNSINLYNTSSSSIGFYHGSGSLVNVKNNSIVNTGGGYALRINNRTQYIGDYNNIYTGTSQFAYYAVSRTSLSAWRTFTFDDANSVSVNPSYADTFNLHSSSASMNNAGTPVGVLDDIDGEIRSTTSPDIGADEFNAVPRDINLVELIPNECEGSNTVELKLQNSGTTALTSGRIKWSLATNGGSPVNQTDFVIGFSLASLKDTVVNLGSITFNRGDFYKIYVQVDSVNGALDQNKVNDTLEIDSLYTRMAGTYTVGGISPDFTTMSAATSALLNRGICGRVFINLRSGSYPDRIYIPRAIDGADTAQAITFQSDTSTTSKSELYSSSYVVEIRNADNIRIHNLKLRYTGNVDATQFFNSSNLHVDSNEIEGVNVLASSQNPSVLEFVNASGSAMSDITIEDNIIRYGGTGINLNLSLNSDRFNLKNNSILDFTRMGVYSTRTDSLDISGNTIRNKSLQNVDVHGIYLRNSSQFLIYANKIELDVSSSNFGYKGIYALSSTGSSGNNASVYNNFVAIDGAGNTAGNNRGMMFTSCSYLRIDHNSVNLVNSSNSSEALYISSSSNHNIRNNSLVNQTGGKAIYITSVPIAANNNNYYSSGSVLGYYAGNRSNLANWRSATGRDQQSISVNPNYFSNTNLHTASVDLNSSGMNLSYISDDIDGDARSSTRDIGADEFTPLARDGQLLEVVSTRCPGNNNIDVDLKNTGSLAISNATINWWISTNGSAYIAQSTYRYSGNLSTNASTRLTLGVLNFQNGNSYSILAAIDSINQNVDLNQFNDSALMLNQEPALTGTYSIGSQGDFTSIAQADSALDRNGVCGAVTLNMLQGSYNESVELGGYAGVSAVNTITIQADTANTASVDWINVDAPIKLVNAKYIRIQDLSITSTGSNAIYLSGECEELEIIDNEIQGAQTSSLSLNLATMVYMTTTAGKIRGLHLEGNSIERGSYGFYIAGSSINRHSGVEVLDNDFSGYRYNGYQSHYVDSQTVNENSFKNLGNGYGTTAITVLYSNQLSVQLNEVDHSKLGGRSALYVGWSSGNAFSRNVIANNMLSSYADNNSTGVDLRNNTYTDFYYNSIGIEGNANGSRGLYAANGSNNRYRNNNIVNLANGYAIYSIGGNEYVNSNYNNLFSSSSTRLGYYRGQQPTSLSAWRTSSSQDMNSVSGDPLYRSSGDLHALGLASHNTGVPLAGFSIDIDGQSRSGTSPDIGADEYTASPDDAGLDSLSSRLFCSGVNNIDVVLTNYGTDTLTSAVINWAVAKDFGTAVAQTAFNWSGSLLTGQSAVVNIGSLNFNGDTTYQVSAYTSSPNAKTDGYAGNDTTQNMATKAAMSGVYIVDQSGGADYTSVAAAVNELKTRGVCAATTIRVKDGTYTSSLHITRVEGMGPLAPIVIESDTSNSAPATLNSGGHAVLIDGMSHLTLKGFKIASSGKSPVHLTNGNSNVQIIGNQIENKTLIYRGQLSVNSGLSVHNQSGTPNVKIAIENNTIKGGYYGVYYVNTAKADSGNIKNNLITDFTSYGLVGSNDHSLRIVENDILDSTFQYGSRGVELSNCNVDFIANRVVLHQPGWGTAVYIRFSQDTSAVRRTIANNAISLIQQNNSTSTSAWGLCLYSSSNQNIYNNSIWMEGGSNTSSKALYLLLTTGADVKNNSVVNNQGGLAMHMTSSNTVNSCDYNNLFTSGGTLIQFQNSSYVDVLSWRNGTAYGSNSTSADANYMTAYEMRPNHIALDGRATSLAAVSVDIEGVSRGSSPDIGAYQFNTRKDDAGSIALVTSKLCTGTQNVIMALKNFGGDTLKSVQMAWSVSHNGGPYVAQSSYSWSGVLPPGDVDSNVQVGAFNFSGGDYRIHSYTYSPNGNTDELLANDTLNDQLLVQFSGSYTLGDTASDFMDWSSFSQSINAAGVCGPVVLRAKPRVYNESFVLRDIEGLSASNTLLITRDTGSGPVLIEDTLSVLTLWDMQHTTIKQLEIKNNGGAAAIQFEGSNAFVTLDSNRVQGPITSNNLGTESAIYINSNSTSANHNLTISNNSIANGSSGIYCKGYSRSYPDRSITIENNTIEDFQFNGIYTYALDTLSIEGNDITSSLVYGKTASNGISMVYTDYYKIRKNSISLYGETATATGVLINRSSGTNLNSSEVINNFIHVDGGNGINASFSNNIGLYYNSVHITPGKYISGYVLRSYASSGVDLMNNSFANIAGGLVYDQYTGFTSNYNNLYTTGAQFARTNISDLAAWRTASNQDANSVSADPIYLSDADLHANQTLMDSSAAILAAISTDIDGDTRDPSFPDIGADEYDLIKNVGVVEMINPVQRRARKWTSTAFSGVDTIGVVVRNFGPDVTDIPIELEFLGINYLDTIRGTLGAGKRDTFFFPNTINLDTTGEHIVRVFTSMPNDQYIENDTMDVLIVSLENGQAKLPYFEDFEGIKDTTIFENYLGLWDIEEIDFVSNGGRLQTKSGKKSTGQQAITLDRTPNGPIIKNELLVNLNLSRYDVQDSLYLSFDYIDHRDERHKGDSVWVRGSDTSAWIGVYDLWRNRRTNRVKKVNEIAITPFIASAGQTYSTSFQIRFGQEDNQKLPGDGRTFDNIKLRGVLPVDMAIEDAHADFSQVPVDMANNRFHATVHNLGYNTADSVYLNADVDGVLGRVMLDSLQRESDSTLSVTDSLGSVSTGVYGAKVFANYSGTDKCFENDTVDFQFSITDSTLARDGGRVDSTFGFNVGTGEMGTVLEVFEEDTITSVSFYLNFPTIGDSLKARVYAFNNNVVGPEVAATEVIAVTSNASRWYTLPIKCLEVLPKGNYLVAVEQTQNYLTLGITEDNYKQGVSFIKKSPLWQAFEDSLDGYLFSIHANFGLYDLPILTVPSSVCVGDPDIVLKSNKSGGRFYGHPAIINDSIFSPQGAGVGVHRISYSLLRPNGCTDVSAIEILVDSLPNVGMTSLGSYCENDSAFVPFGGTPVGGTYFGDGVQGALFYPSQGTIGTDTIFYRYEKPVSGCADTAFNIVSIKQKPNVLFGPIGDYCLNDGLDTLNTGIPSGGIYFGSGISLDSLFDPVAAGLGTYSLSYLYEDVITTCSDTANVMVTVNDTPQVELGADTTLCFGQKLSLSGQSIGTYLWNTGDTTEHLQVTQQGTYWLRLTNLQGCVNRDTINVEYDGACVSVEELRVEPSVRYYPNPSKGVIHIELDFQEFEVYTLKIRNVLGEEITNIQWLDDRSNHELDLSQYPSGVYLFELQSGDWRDIQRITIE